MSRIAEIRFAIKPWKGEQGALGPGRFTSASGMVIDFFNPRTSKVPILPDLLTGIVNQCRWGGHIPGPLHYSVAAHCVWVSEVCEMLAEEFSPGIQPYEVARAALGGLTHDIEEGVCQDLIRPVKYHMGPEYRRLADEWRAVILEDLEIADMVAPWKELIRLADDLALVAEDGQIRGGHVNRRVGATVPDWVPPVDGHMSPWQAGDLWLIRFESLMEEARG